MLELLHDMLLYRPQTPAQTLLLVFTWVGIVTACSLLAMTVISVFRGAERLLLIGRYLRRKLTPLFAAVAVTLCTAMVIIVISVMGGFLNIMREAVQTLTGQVTIYSDITGFPYYEELLEDLRSRPEIEAATTIISAYGLVNLQLNYGDAGNESDSRIMTVQVHGIRPRELDTVTGFGETIYWTRQQIQQDLDRVFGDPKKLDAQYAQAYEKLTLINQQTDLREHALTLKPPAAWGELPGMVLGIHVNPNSTRDSQGEYARSNWSVGSRATVTVLPLTKKGTILEPAVREMMVVNEFKSGLYEIDQNRVYVPFDLLQQMLQMNESPQVNPQTGELTGLVVPARTNEIMVKAKPGVPLDQLERVVLSVTNGYYQRHGDAPFLVVRTWEQRFHNMLSAVEKEKRMVTFLFVIISVVAVVMVMVTFYMIVLEKTRDIGTLRAIGCSRMGIASIFLGYGLAIGIVGAGLGWCLAASVVWNLNEIQDLLAYYFNFRMWDPSVYYFDRIPDRIDTKEATVILFCSVLSAVIGAIIPAVIASRMRPVEALRYE